MLTGSFRSSDTKSTRCPVSLSVFASSRPSSSSTSPNATRAPASANDVTNAAPNPRAPPVTRMRRPASASRMTVLRLLSFQRIERGKMLLRALLEHAAHARHAHIVLIQELVVAGVRRHAFEHVSILFQHRPVQSFETSAIHEFPRIALPARDLAGAPEVDLAIVFIDRNGEADDPEVAARA